MCPVTKGLQYHNLNLNLRRPVGRPRKTCLESVDADMAELEIDKEDVHDRKRWRMNVMKRIPTLSENVL